MEILLFILVGGLVIGIFKNLLITSKKNTSAPDIYDTHWTSEKKQRQKKHSERVKESQERSKNRHSKMTENEKIIEQLSRDRARQNRKIELRKRENEQLQNDLLESQSILEEKLKYSGGWNKYDELPLEEAMKLGVSKQKSCVYKISVGGLEYIGFTTQLPEKRLDQHLDDARKLSKQKLHVQLRKFGYIHDFKIISEHENEILGLVAEISSIKKYEPELNTSKGGEGNIFTVFEKDSLHGEVIFFVRKNVFANI